MDFKIDMIKLEVPVWDNDFDVFSKELSCSPSVDYKMRTGLSEYRHNFTIHENYGLNIIKEFMSDGDDKLILGENRFYLAFQHNSEGKDKDRHNMIIQYNPNKCSIVEGLLFKILSTFYYNNINVVVKSVDVCVDLFDISIDNLVWCREKKRLEFDYKGSKGRTVYIGARGSDGSIKVYDKGAEQKVDKVWTRWEITLNIGINLVNLLYGVCEVSANIATVYFFDERQLDRVIDTKLRAVLYSVVNGYMKLSDFDYRYVSKIKECLEDVSIIKVDSTYKEQIEHCIVCYIKDMTDVLEANTGVKRGLEYVSELTKLAREKEFGERLDKRYEREKQKRKNNPLIKDYYRRTHCSCCGDEFKENELMHDEKADTYSCGKCFFKPKAVIKGVQ